ncbi:MAG: endonuclease MutS2 [Clostridiaceae bacterium]
MNQKSLDKLEFNTIKEEIKKSCVSSAGGELIEALHPYANIVEARRALQEVDEAVRLLSLKGSAPFEGVFDVREPIARVGKGSTLNPGALLKISNILRSARLFVRYIKSEEFPATNLSNLTSGITPLPALEEEIAIAILGEDEVSDRASQKLSSIRRAIKEKSASVKDKIQSLVRSNAKYLQDSLYTVRGDRYVIPVKAEHKGSVPGLIHDQSASGQTLYIEPLSLVNLNNEIKELMLKEKAEIERILRELSEKVTDNHPAVKRNADIIYFLDSVFARAKYAQRIDALAPEIRDDGTFHLYSARHPLIDQRMVVPSTIYIGENFTSLVITGPNTGGKTVTLKTVGLLHAMALSGILIPVNEHSHVAFFHEIFADIGDEQSIEQNLSTFSSHMTNIVRIMAQADETSLCLFDELGAGTDPTEGAALAMAILEELRSRSSRVIATTHYSELKAYALRTEGVENASVEFDVNSLRPTFRLLIGVPGKSNAFLISKRLGLSDDIIEKSKELITEDSLKFEDLIENLQKSNISASQDAQKSKAVLLELEEKEQKLDEKLANIETQRQKQIDEARREARNLLREVKEEADSILKTIRNLETSGFSGNIRQELEKNRQKLRDTLELIEEDDDKTDRSKPSVSDQFLKSIKPGADFMHRGFGQKVSVLSWPDKDGNLMVQAGIIKMNANVRDLETTKEMKKEAKAARRTVNLNLRQVSASLDLRGLDGEEAAYRTDQYLDEAALANLKEVTIIHGVGTGVLKTRINQLLKKHPHVKTSRPGAYGEGGAGVTMVEIK